MRGAAALLLLLLLAVVVCWLRRRDGVGQARTSQKRSGQDGMG